VVVADGLYNVILSTWEQGTLGRDLELAFDDTGSGRYMQVTIVDGPGTALDGVVLLPRQQIASVPYALVAGRADALAQELPVSVRVVEFETSVRLGWAISSSTWTPLVRTDDTPMALSVTPASDQCIIEVAGMASFQGDDNNRVFLTILENGSAVGVPHTLDFASVSGGRVERLSVSAQYVKKQPTPTAHTYTLGARKTGGNITQGASDDVNSGVSLKVVMECPD
jgi:hypothetical protein